MARNLVRFAAAVAALLLVDCSGNGPEGDGPALSVEPARLTFEAPFVGGTYVQELTLKNPTAHALIVESISIEQDAASHASLAVLGPALPLTLEPAATQTVGVQLRPSDSRVVSARIHFRMSGPTAPEKVVEVSSTVMGQASLSICARAAALEQCATADGRPVVDFGPLPIGSVDSRTVTLSNEGSGNVAILVRAVELREAGVFSGDFEVKLTTLGAAGERVDASLPFFLVPAGSDQVVKNELQVEVRFTANAAAGTAISGPFLLVTTDHAPGAADLPITAASCDPDGSEETTRCGGCDLAIGQSCGECGGSVRCDGSCSMPTPEDHGEPCGSCGGRVTCDGACSIATPSNYGTPCGACGGTWTCDGTCSVLTPSNFGSTCNGNTGVVLCDSSCGPNPDSIHRAAEWIEPGVGLWGDWTPFHWCPVGSHAYGFELRSEGPSSDNTALNAVRLFCRPTTGGSDTAALMPHPGFWGNWGSRAVCPHSSVMRSARMQIEGNQGDGDDTAANNIAFRCTDSSNTLIGASVGTNWGAWGSEAACPGGSFVCGIAVRIEGQQGGGDDSALNGVRLKCCNQRL